MELISGGDPVRPISGGSGAILKRPGIEFARSRGDMGPFQGELESSSLDPVGMWSYLPTEGPCGDVELFAHRRPQWAWHTPRTFRGPVRAPPRRYSQLQYSQFHMVGPFARIIFSCNICCDHVKDSAKRAAEMGKAATRSE
eukprot:7691074-Pyramimonas_sp.AAC.1